MQTASRTQGLPRANGGATNGCPMGDNCCKVNGGGGGCSSSDEDVPVNGVNGRVNGVNGHANGHGHANGNGLNGHANGNGVGGSSSSEEDGPARGDLGSGQAKQAPPEETVSGVPVVPGQGGIAAIGAVKKTSADDKCFDADTFMPYDPSQEPIFPPELKVRCGSRCVKRHFSLSP